MVTKESKGFYVSLPHNRYSSEKGISFQLRPDGVRYFLKAKKDEMPRRQRARLGRNTNPIRDISTQIGSFYLSSGYLGQDVYGLVEKRLISHAETFYPEDVIPDDQKNVIAWAAFPMLGATMKLDGERRMPPRAVNLQIAAGLRAFSVKDMTMAIFGEAPRQLQAAAAQSLIKYPNVINIEILTFGSLLRGYLPANSLAEVLQMDFDEYSYMSNMDKMSAGEIRLLLRRFSSTRIMRMIRDLATERHGFHLLRDAARQYADARKQNPDVVMDLSRQFRTFKELHDVISHEYRKLKQKDMPIEYGEVAEALSRITLPDGARLVWPGSTHELIDWSSDKAMNNCIYSYGRDAAEGHCLLLGIVDASGKMVVNVMIRGKHVAQCYGKANARCSDEAQIAALFEGLIREDLIHEESDHKRWVGENRWW